MNILGNATRWQLNKNNTQNSKEKPKADHAGIASLCANLFSFNSNRKKRTRRSKADSSYKQ